MGNFNWLQFSDLHFSTRESYSAATVRRALVRCLKELKQEKEKFDYVFITGDIALKASYEGAASNIDSILNAAAVDKGNVFWAAGNHDIKRGSKMRGELIASIRNAPEPSAKFEELMADDEARSVLTNSGMSDYIKEYNGLLGRSLSADEISGAHILYNLEHCNLIVLNTCLTSFDDNDRNNLMITEPGLLKVFDGLGDMVKPLIVIGHHGKEFLHYSEGEKLARLFEDSGADIYMCGHSHNLGYARFDDAGRDIPQITCGCGIANGYGTICFVLGEYDSDSHTMRITPYSFQEAGRFEADYGLHRRLTTDNNTFHLSRFKKSKTETTADVYLTNAQAARTLTPKLSFEDRDLFDRSQRYYDLLMNEGGRFYYLKVNEKIFPDIKTFTFDSFIRAERGGESQKLTAALRESADHLLLIGDGGAGKTVSLLYVWDTLLKDRNGDLPLYIPLNEYKPHPEFIREYIRLYYGSIDIHALNRRYLLLLDGFNEISGDALPLVREIQELMQRKNGFVRIVVTSRHGFFNEYHSEQQANQFKICHLQPLDDAAVNEYLALNNIPCSEAPSEVLRTPMMLTLYAQTCSVQKRVTGSNIFDFKPNAKRGELINNFLLCQIANLIIIKRWEDIAPTWYTLFAAAPYIAYHMESEGVFFIEKTEYRQHMAEFMRSHSVQSEIDYMPEGLKELMRRYKPAIADLPVEDILLYRQYLFVEENGRYTFKHQDYRDFFAAQHVANTIRESLAAEQFELLPEITRPWSIYVRDMLGDIYGDYINADGYHHYTPLHELLGRLRGNDKVEGVQTIVNVLVTWRTARGNRIIGEDLSELDLSRIPMNDVTFSKPGIASSFNSSVISSTTLLPQGHSGWVTSVVYSADGERILSASYDGTIKEWDRETGECLRTFEGHSDSVNSAVYSADGRRLLSASRDGTIMEWGRETGACLRTIEGHSGEVNSAVYSTDGIRLLSASYDGTIKEWDRETGECLRTFEEHLNAVHSAVYSADGRRLLSASRDGTIKEWDRETSTCLRMFEGHTDKVTSVAYSADGRRVLSASWDFTIKEWDRETGVCLRTFKGHIIGVTSAVYSADEGRVLSASQDFTIKEWDRETEACLRTYEGHSSGVSSVVYSLKDERLLSASHDGTIKEWDRETGVCLRTFEGYSNEVNNAAYSADGGRVLSASADGTIKEWDRETGACLRTFEGHTENVNCAAYSADGGRVLSTSDDETIKEWDRETGVCLRTFGGYFYWVTSAAYSADGVRVLSASHDETVKEWDRETGVCLRMFEGHSRVVNSAVYCADGERVLSASNDETIKEWDRKTGACLRTFEGHTENVNCAAYSADGGRVLSASDDETIKEWDRETGDCLRTFKGHSSWVTSAVYSADGRWLLSASADRTIKEWDRETGVCLHTFEGHSSGVSNAVYSADGGRVLSASADGTIKEWDRKTGSCLWTSPPYSGVKIAGCEFKGCHFSSPDIKQLVRQYGGIVVNPVLCGVHADSLQGEERRINISLKNGATHQNLIITGYNGSGKTSLLLGIKQYMEATLESGAIGDITVSLTDDDNGEASRVLKLEYETGAYRFLFFPVERLFINNGVASFWDRLDKTQAIINQYLAERRGVDARALEALINRIVFILRDLFCNESIRLNYDRRTHKFHVFYRINVHSEIELELYRESLPYGYGSALDIFWRIIAPWEDITASFDGLRGLAIIDELESHLDIKMQKRILPCLTKLFPSMQFIIATNSPYILNSAKNAVIFDMETDQELVTSDLELALDDKEYDLSIINAAT